MFGTAEQLVKRLHGDFHHVGTMSTEELVLPADSNTPLPIGTFVDRKDGDEFIAQLASGRALGFLTQSLTAEGQTSVQAFKDRMIGKQNLPIKKGQHVSVRVPHPDSEWEFEGLGEAVPGNLVCTEGTGALTDAEARDLELSFFNGCIREAQAGDVVQMLLQDSGLTPVTEGNLRIRVKFVGGYVKA